MSDSIPGLITIVKVEICQREWCVHITITYSGCLILIGDFETFHYSPLRGNFAAYLCEWQWKALRCRALTSR